MQDFRLTAPHATDHTLRIAHTAAPCTAAYSPYYRILWAEGAAGQATIDTVNYQLAQGTHVFFLTPFQPHHFDWQTIERFVMIEFNTDFFCLERHNAEVGCNGTLFNTATQVPYISLEPSQSAALASLLMTLMAEMRQPDFAHRDLLLAYLKIFLIQATRIRQTQRTAKPNEAQPTEPVILQRLHKLIEQHYLTDWQASDYAAALHLAPASLAAILRKLEQKNLSRMLQDRLLIAAKRMLYYENTKPVKEIAYDLGFKDPSYFIRFFKKNTSRTPESYRRIQYELVAQ